MDSYRFVGHLSGSVVCQVLISDADLRESGRMEVLATVIEECFRAGVIPVINGNDVFDRAPLDNDAIAAVVAVMIAAEKLLLLTDVPGVMRRRDDPLSTIAELTVAELASLVLDDCGSGRGGMRSKVRVAEIASHNGIETQIASAALPAVVARCIAGERVGTRLHPCGKPLAPAMRWIAGVLTSRGSLTINKTAQQNIVVGGSSLFASGTKRVSGVFAVGDVVDIRAPDGTLLARGASRISSALLILVRALKTEEIAIVFTEILQSYAAVVSDHYVRAVMDRGAIRMQVRRALDIAEHYGVEKKRQLAYEVLQLFPNTAIEAMVGGLSQDYDPLVALRVRYSRMSNDLSIIDRSRLAVFANEGGARGD